MSVIVVSGHRRSGTSAMMQALLAGLGPGSGWGVLTQQHQERLNKEANGYIPNPGPLYEVGRMFYKSAKFLRMIPDQSLVKIFWDGITNLPKGDYIVVWMDRDEAEINASIAKSDAHLRATGVKENAQTHYTFDIYRPYNRDDVEHVLGIIEQRQDMRLIRIDFKDLIENPEWAFEQIRHTPLGKTLVPIDVQAAAEVIKPEHYRVRIDDDDSQGRGPERSAERENCSDNQADTEAIRT